MLAKVPRIITSWFPRRLPYELNSSFGMPWLFRYAPAGPSSAMSPAGEMWSVVTESPSTASTRAPEIFPTGSGAPGRSSKNGGFLTKVEEGSHEKHSDFGTGSFFHVSSPANTPAYSLRNISGSTADRTASVISRGDGQISWRNTGFPLRSAPSGSHRLSVAVRSERL